MADFLLEIGLEEVPARMLPAAQAELLRRTVALMSREGLLEDGVTLESETVAAYSTPRRLAVVIRGVREQQADATEEVTGPAVKIAFKDGQPTPAAEAFARKAGVMVAQLKTINTPKGEYLVASTTKKGRGASEVLGAELPKEIGAIYWAKNMYWRPGKPERFVRPVLWITCLLGDAVVPVEFAGKVGGRATYGHRVLSSGEAFEIVAPDSYVAQLEGEYVLVDVEARRHKIRKALDRVTRTIPGGARWCGDESLVDAVTHLTEWPEVLLGTFGSEFLRLPEEVLVTVMRDHQKYFAVEDSTGRLAPHFLTVLNIALSEENESIIRQGNERVLRARFNDARFFWEFDQRTSLRERVKLLENITFQKELGSYALKSERVRSVATKLVATATLRGVEIDAAAVNEAAVLAKADLTTELVKEFTELQGIIGGLYARSQGASGTVAYAIYDQYLPASADDAIPRSLEGAVLGLADRIDTLAGMFGLGMEPSGSKDPFALRRAANSVVRILAESGIRLKLTEVIGAAAASESLATRLRLFFEERVAFFLREVRGQAYDVVNAVMISGSDDLPDLLARAEAVTAVRGSEDFIAVSAAFKRMKNILQQALDKHLEIGSEVNNSLLENAAEFALAQRSAEVVMKVDALRERGDYRAALEEVATLRPQVDGFFNAVMVMAPQEDVRKNRLALLGKMVADFSRIADFSEIVTAG